MEKPAISSRIKMNSYKHDGNLHRCWERNTVISADDNHIIGINDHTLVTEATGKRWHTKEPALFYFDRTHWFNIIYIMRKEQPYYYCNISSPYTFSEGVLRYIDYDIDVIVKSDFTYQIVDMEDYERHKERFGYSQHVQNHIHQAIATLKQWIDERNRPFQKEFIQYWMLKYNDMNG
jgi:protein associated with RNAse G/E